MRHLSIDSKMRMQASYLVAACVFVDQVLGDTSSKTVAKVVRDVNSKNGLRLLRSFEDGYEAAPGVVWGSYTNDVNTTGWGLLSVHGNTSYSDEQIALAAGLFEGALMASVETADGAVNLLRDYVKNTGADADLGPELDTWLAANDAYIASQVASHPGDPYWHHVGLTYTQLQGMVEGYAQAAPNDPLPPFAFRNVNLVGDLFDLIPAVGGPEAAARLPDRIRKSHCSALIRWLPDASDILAAHTTWSGVESMLRTYKMYDLPYTINGDPASGRVPSARHIQSSYPSSLYSSDDHYVLGSGLIVIETTIGNNNASLYKQYVSNASVLEWVRNVVANRLAVDGESWMLTFARENSGTYNNEWMVVDSNRFVPGSPTLAPGTFTVGDQMPGYFVWADQTPYLQERGFFPSYNVPFYPEVYNVSGQWDLVAQYGQFFTWGNTSRAQIFAREAPKVADMSGMKRVMRFNDFQNDPISTMGCGSNPTHSAVNAISDRADLNDPAGTYLVPDVGYGDSAGIDSKIASAADIKRGANLAVWAQCGPTHDQQPAFSWVNSTLTTLKHASMPTVFDFDWTYLAFPADA